MEHLDSRKLQGLRDGTLRGEEYLHTLEHIGECSACAEQLAELVEEQPLLEAPQGIGAGVRRKLAAPDENAVKSYRIYRRRVLLAMCATLILVFSGVFAQFGRIPVDKISQANTSLSEKIRDGFTVFSQKLWIMEDRTHEQAKK